MSDTTFYGWLSDDPPVIYHQGATDPDVGAYLPEHRIHRLVKYVFHLSAEAIAADYERAKRLRPKHRIQILLNDEDTARRLRGMDLPAHFVNHGCLLDERIYDVDPTQEKSFDAVYNAWFNEFKRHLLACDVPTLALIGAATGTFYGEGDSATYVRRVRQGLSHAHFVNLDLGRYVGDRDVARWLNRARTGLCLSAVEGGMYAATEYLLCGLPVVSTPSVGGRDTWFRSAHTRIVADEPRAVAQGVADLIARQLDPIEIRQETLRIVWEHRRRLIDLVQQIYDDERAGRDFAREFYSRFVNKLGSWRPASEVWERRKADCAA